MSIRYIIIGAAGHLGSALLKILGRKDCRVNALHLPEESQLSSFENIWYADHHR